MMKGLELPAQLVMIYLLLHLRYIGLMFSSPIFTATLTPAPFRYLFAVMLTVCSVGIINTESIPLIYFDEVIFIAAICLRELLIGIALGFIASLPLFALRVAGEQTGSMIGFSMAQIMDPTTQSETSIVGQLHFLIAMWFYFRWNGHLLMVQALVETLKLVPPGQISLFPAGDLSLGTWLQNIFILGIRMVIPFYCALVLSDVGLGFLARTVPQMNIFVVGLPVKVMLGFMVLAAVVPLIMDLIRGQMERWIEFALSVLRLWRPVL
ncbi:MAG: flagellar biosynthetic protein FliR [Synergistales bacterium]|nr:flagellar biosynthetic protein FliR [Synergistales bacterium]MDY6401356.1 flagellar biosynthetic protein FliR [Synergistales bacterium]MDY6405204.1 flagellar biosynthetic protein FliR [Synergistales bacterium]MDY6410026.1 flagellar biosynthetic protein FliR [Synergistales bacterium]MDY6414990.1 flagellar biosynthetic protein FliR [Synergistales bacterium]